ncbi:Repressible alkaline phosphatase [Sphaceloma murrayae]|uniref:Alkaline phosphatase n=1 Tax=Sphaceloma murrayae TaxID=2082308 RepID=A0A2K1QPN0_9PEZI|nr:Repressible alkaline phosphatase [Sphaceloma murrayae]
MARDTEPLLARRASSHNSQAAAEEDALLTGQPQPRSYLSSPQWRRLRETLAFIWAFLATIAIIILAVLLQHRSHSHTPPPPTSSPSPPPLRPTGKRNLIFMVSDGMGPSSLSLTRSFNQHIHSLPYNHTLLLDNLLLGQSRTLSSSSWVTDSAAGATAFSCGLKSYNGAISMLPDGTPCPSVMEGAKRAGYKTGVVVTTRVTDATPACFGAHVKRREMEDGIAGQMLGLDGIGAWNGSAMDLILGGGRCHFLGSGQTGSCRGDGRDLVREAEKGGWAYVDSREGFDALEGKKAEEVLPLLGLWAGGDVPFEIDRRLQNKTYPSLEESARTALRLLSEATADSEQGFFIMIEGSRIDHAGHINDPAAQVHEVLAYDRTMQAVLDFIEDSDTPTLMVATSDHETGGLAIARQLDRYVYPHYTWYPSVLANATSSAELTAHEYHTYLASHPATSSSSKTTKSINKYLTTLITDKLGFVPTTQELKALTSRPVFAIWILGDMISRRAQIGWSSHGHTAADVNIYSSAAVRSPARQGKGGRAHDGWMKAVRERLGGNRENTDVGAFLRWWLDVEGEVEEVGRELVSDEDSVVGVHKEVEEGLVEAKVGVSTGDGLGKKEGFRHDEEMRALEGEYEEWKEGWKWD